MEREISILIGYVTYMMSLARVYLCTSMRKKYLHGAGKANWW